VQVNNASAPQRLQSLTAFVDALGVATYRRFLQRDKRCRGRGGANNGGAAMARRQAGKTSPKPAIVRDRGARSRAKIDFTENSLKERLSAAERECDALRETLEREQARVRKLEEVNAAARDRIAWALDTLQNILEAKR
jgi:hypothetical protein